MKILFLGDIIGKIGRKVCAKVLPEITSQYAPDLILANGENSAHGYGINLNIYKELIELGIQGITLGNHTWDKKEFIKEVENLPQVVRPANYPPGLPGKDRLLLTVGRRRVSLINLLGRTFMHCVDCPFQTIEKLLPQLERPIIIVDMHAEATSEKAAMAWFLDGKVSAVLGTHTHVMTADERILPQGTAFISDLGMVGAYNSVIGMDKEQIIKRFLTQMPEKFEPSETGPGLFNAVLLEIDDQSGRAKEIKRLFKILPA